MAMVVGYRAAITHLDVARVYYPVGLGEQSQTAQQIGKELLRVLKVSGGVQFVERWEGPVGLETEPGEVG